MKSFSFPQNPIYIPKVQDSSISKWKLNLPVVCVNAFTLARWPTVNSIRDHADILIVDPVTDRILYGVSQKKKNFKKLNYPDAEPEDIYSNKDIRQVLIEQSIKNQLQARADILIAPYLFAEDTDDTKFTINLTLLSETVRYLEKIKEKKSLFAMICIGNTVFNRPIILNHIIDRYNDDFADHLSGFFLSINDLNGRSTTDETKLLNLAYFVFRLSEYKPVIIKRLDAFGEILSAIGASGYSSGLAMSETFLANQKDDTPRKPLKRIYAPEIFDYLNDEEAKEIKYECHPASNSSGSHPEGRHIKAQHYLHHHLDRMGKMQSLSREQKISYMLKEIGKAKKKAVEWSDQFGILPKFLHASRWTSVLEKAKDWKPSKQNDEELSMLLAELEK
ncbi:MAG: hypothetical protein WC531_01120 [Candidatus Paceibacterota bacterium]|jgi:hypothetical protein